MPLGSDEFPFRPDIHHARLKNIRARKRKQIERQAAHQLLYPNGAVGCAPAFGLGSKKREK